MATIRVDISAENSASREILRLRSEVNNLGEQIAKNNARTASGTAAERAKTAETNRGLRAQQMLLRAQQNRQAIALAGLRQESGLLANVRRQTELLDRETRNAGGGARIFSTAFGELAGTLGAIGITEVAFGIVQAGAAATRASIQVEAATNTFEALGLGAAGAEQRVAELIELSRNPGISFPQAIQAATRLETVGISGSRADSVIREFGNSLALVGSTDLSGILLGLEQIVSAGRVTTEEIRQITERSGIAAQAIRDEFGTLIGDDIQQQLDAAGQGVQQFVDRVVAQLETRGRAAVDSTQNSFQNLQNSVFLLGAEIGDRFTPALGAAARGISGFLDGITEGIRGTKDFTQVLADLNAEFVRASGRVELREAIEGGIESLEAFIAQSEEAIRNNSVFFGGREDAILLGQIRQAREELQELQGVQEQNIETEADLRAELVRQEAELERIQGLQTERNNLIAEQGASARRASRIYLENLTEEEIAVIESIEGLEAKIAAYEAAGMAAEEATDTATEGTEEATTSTKDLVTEVQRLTQIYNDLATNVQEANEQFDLIQQSGFADFYRLVRGEIEAYGGAVDTVIPSVVNLTQAENALTAAIESNLQTISTFTGEAQEILDAYLSLSDGLTSYAADQAIANAEARLVNPAISEAADTMRDYIAVMGDVQGEFQTTDAISDRLTESVRDQASAFDALARSAGRAATAQQGTPAHLRNQLPGQVIGSDVFDRFNAQTPGTASGITAANAADIENIFGGIESVGFGLIQEAAQRQAQQAAEIDTVTESLTVFGDVAVRLAAGDMTALATALTRTFTIIEEQNAAFEERRRLRGIRATDDHLRRATRFQNLRAVQNITGVDIDSDVFGDFRQNLASGIQFDPANINQLLSTAVMDSGLSEGVTEALLRLTANIDRELTSDDINRVISEINRPIIAGFQEIAAQAEFNLNFATQTGGDVQGALQDVIRANTDLTQAQIDNANEQRRATGESIENVEQLNRILQALNNESRLALQSVAPNVFSGRSLVRGTQALAERTGTDRQFTEDIARAQYGDVAYDAEVAAATPDIADIAGDDPAVAEALELAGRAAERISDNTLSRSIRTSTETLNDLIRAGNSVADLQSYINTELVPLWVQEYDEMVQDLVDQGHTLEDAQQIVSSEYGTSAEFTANRTSAIIDPITEANAETATRVAERVSDGSRGRAIRMATDTLNDMVSAGDSVSNIQSYINTTLVPLWEDEYQDMIGDLVAQGFTLEQATQIVEAEHGTQAEFTSGRVDAIITPITERNQEIADQVAELVSDGSRGRAIRTATDTLNDMVSAGTSVADLLTFINTELVPLWEQDYDDMIGDLVAQGFTLEQATQIVEAEHGTQAEFTSGRVDAIITPITEANAQKAQQVAELVSDGTRGRAIRTATNTLGDMIAAGTSVADLLTFINTELVPLWGQEYDDMIQDLVTQGYTLEQATQIVSAQHGTRSEFTSGRVDAIITPITEANTQKAQQVAELVSDGMRGREIRMTTEALNGLIEAGTSVADLLTFINTELVPLWEQEYQDMIGDLVAQGYTLEQATQIVGAEHGTQAEFTGNRTSAIITPITEANQATAEQVAETVSDGRRGRDIRIATETLNDMIGAGTSVADLLTYINTTLVPLWGQEYDDMIQDLVAQGFTLEQAEAIISAQHGTRSEFIGDRTSAIITPITEANQATAEQVAEIVSDNQLATSIRTSTGGLQDLIKAGASVADLQSYITTELVPLWESEYQDMIGDLVAQGYTLEQATQIVESQHGTRDVFISGRTDAIITPITESNEATAARVAERVSDGSRGRAIRTTTEALGDLVEAGTSIADLQTYINTELVPLWRSQYQDMIDDLVEQGLTLEQAQAIVSAEHGTADEFVSGRVSDVIDPIRTSRQASATRNARRTDRFGIRTARFNLGEATSEEEFDTLFGVLQTAVNTFYDNEEERIRALGLSVEETNQLLAENDQDRREELAGLSRITNTFAQDRINTAEREQREIEALRDDAFENERNRKQRLVDLEQETQNRILDIQRNANRSREDIERDFQDAYQDIQRQRVFGEITDEEASSRLQELGRERLRDLRDIDIRTGRRQEDVGIRQGRSEAEIEASAMATATAIREALAPLLTGQEMSPSEMAMDAAMTPPAEASAMTVENTGTTAENTTEISDKLDPITQISDYNADMLGVLRSSLLVHTRSAVNLETLVNVARGGETARDQIVAEIESFGEIVPDIVDVAIAGAIGGIEARGAGMAIAGAPVDTRMMMAGEPVSPQAMEAMNVSISAQNVTVSGGNVGGGGEPPPIMIENRTTVELDGDKVGQSVGNKIVQQGANRRNLLGRDD